jgi:hypothetical protein
MASQLKDVGTLLWDITEKVPAPQNMYRIYRYVYGKILVKKFMFP